MKHVCHIDTIGVHPKCMVPDYTSCLVGEEIKVKPIPMDSSASLSCAAAFLCQNKEILFAYSLCEGMEGKKIDWGQGMQFQFPFAYMH